MSTRSISCTRSNEGDEMRRPKPLILRTALTTTALAALALAPGASADETYSQFVPAGGKISTGSSVSEADPTQLTVSAYGEGTITIVKRTDLSRPPLGKVGEDGEDLGENASGEDGNIYIGPRFDISGDASIDGVEYLILGDRLPEPGFGGWDRFYPLNWSRCHGKRFYYPASAPYCRQQGLDFTGNVGPDGNLRAAKSLYKWNLSAKEKFGQNPDGGYYREDPDGNLSIDLTRLGFDEGNRTSAAISPDAYGDANSLPFVMRKGLTRYVQCMYRCSFTAQATVSDRVKRALGLKSPILAAGTMKTGTTFTRGATYAQLPLKQDAIRALKSKRVATITLEQSGVVTDTWGRKLELKTTGRYYRIILEANTRGKSTCKVRGISERELELIAPRGHDYGKPCP